METECETGIKTFDELGYKWNYLDKKNVQIYGRNIILVVKTGRPTVHSDLRY